VTASVVNPLIVDRPTWFRRIPIGVESSFRRRFGLRASDFSLRAPSASVRGVFVSTIVFVVPYSS
jgi:hypothetical protein